MEKLMRQVEQGTQLTGEAQEWMEKKMKEDPSFADKMNVRAQAKKSLRCRRGLYLHASVSADLYGMCMCAALFHA